MIPADTASFLRDRRGLFIHCGLYALAGAARVGAEPRGIAPPTRLPASTSTTSTPTCTTRGRGRAQAEAGRHAVRRLTTKHHEGFCLWDSELTDYKATNTPYGRTCWARSSRRSARGGLKVGFYYSLIDWHHPEFPIDGCTRCATTRTRWQLNRGRDIARYRDYLHGQVRELLTRYGKIDISVLDFSYSEGTRNRGLERQGRTRTGARAELLAMVRELQPGILVNDRLGRPAATSSRPSSSSRASPMRVTASPVALGGLPDAQRQLGLRPRQHDWKSPELLSGCWWTGSSKGGNLLLNVGPTGAGEFDPGRRDAGR